MYLSIVKNSTHIFFVPRPGTYVVTQKRSRSPAPAPTAPRGTTPRQPPTRGTTPALTRGTTPAPAQTRGGTTPAPAGTRGTTPAPTPTRGTSQAPAPAGTRGTTPAPHPTRGTTQAQAPVPVSRIPRQGGARPGLVRGPSKADLTDLIDQHQMFESQRARVDLMGFLKSYIRYSKMSLNVD